MTAKQHSYIQSLALDAGCYGSGEYAWTHAAASVLGTMSPSKISRKGLTVSQASQVIDALKNMED